MPKVNVNSQDVSLTEVSKPHFFQWLFF